MGKPLTELEREARRARIRVSCQLFADDVPKEEHVEAIMDTLDGPPYGAHTGWWQTHKNPQDRAAEIEEEWRFAG